VEIPYWAAVPVREEAFPMTISLAAWTDPVPAISAKTIKPNNPVKRIPLIIFSLPCGEFEW
jgi:hypothetical protein